MKEMNIAYLSSAYLAPVEYYTKLLAYDKVFVEQYDHYIKQTYRNRCTIAGPSGELALSIPTVKPDTLKCPMKDIRISDHGNWRHLHWNAIESAYNNTPVSYTHLSNPVSTTYLHIIWIQFQCVCYLLDTGY